MTGGRRWLFVAMVHFITFSLALHQQRSVEDGQEFFLELHKTRTDDNLCSVGWTNVKGVCQPRCVKPCVHGACVRPDECLCHRGYGGRLCDEDVNECGLPERPCSQRCVNTHGSYRCYCEPGYRLRADTSTCAKEAPWSSLRCQFDVQVERGEAVGCRCPPGLRLTSDNRTCDDVDECEREAGVCPPRQTCRNTFGSFICVCQGGLVLGTLGGAVECRDTDECLTGAHQCSPHARCLNTDGSYTCQCVEGYGGDGHTCWPRRAPQTRPAIYFNYKLSKRTRPRPPRSQGAN